MFQVLVMIVVRNCFFQLSKLEKLSKLVIPGDGDEKVVDDDDA